MNADRRLPGVSEAASRWILEAISRERLAFVDRALAGTLLRLLPPLDPLSADLLAIGAALASSATREGHSLLDLAGEGEPFPVLPLPPEIPPRREWGGILSGLSPVVGSPTLPAPLILDREGLYLYRYWQAELRVAGALSERLEALQDGEVESPRVRELLAEIFPGEPGESGGESRMAAERALRHRLLVVTGGPGTGKTWTAARILLLFRRLYPGLRAVTAAPTGKAASRMAEALSEVLPADLAVPSMTLHRLLGAGVRGVARREGDFLPWDLVLVDELSMVDLLLMETLLSSLSPRARLVLVGDRDQLSPVGAGAIMGDLCSALSSGGPEGAGGLAVLTRNYRQREAGLLQEFSRAVAEGDGEGALRLFERGAPELVLHPVSSGWPEEVLFEGFAPLVSASSDREALRHLGSFMALSPFRDGPFGALRANRHAERLFSRRLGRGSVHAPAYTPAMVIKNSYDTGLMNGDLGVFSGDRLAFFGGGEGEPDLRHFSLRIAPPWETAFVMTVHKSQGSEYDRVLLLLGGEAHPLLTRRLLYTAATRARKSLAVWASPESLLGMVNSAPARASALEDRLSESLSHRRSQPFQTPPEDFLGDAPMGGRPPRETTR